LGKGSTGISRKHEVSTLHPAFSTQELFMFYFILFIFIITLFNDVFTR
jgi:hypothetical protein